MDAIKSLDNGVIVMRYRILGTDTWVHSAWEPSSAMGEHSTITTVDGKWYGRIGTRKLPPGMETLPKGNARIDIVTEWHKLQYREAYQLIYLAYPDIIERRASMGEIETHEPSQVTT